MRIISIIFIICSVSWLDRLLTKQSKDRTKNISSPDKDLKVGGNCEGCEAIYESPVPFAELNAIDTLPDFNESGSKNRDQWHYIST